MLSRTARDSQPSRAVQQSPTLQLSRQASGAEFGDKVRDKTGPPRQGTGLLPQRLSARDLRRLREAHLAAQRASLESQLAQHRMAALTLELEWRYGLLGKDAVIDIRSGAILPEGPGMTAEPDGPRDKEADGLPAVSVGLAGAPQRQANSVAHSEEGT